MICGKGKEGGGLPFFAVVVDRFPADEVPCMHMQTHQLPSQVQVGLRRDGGREEVR